MKPRLLFNGTKWMCHDNYETRGFGMTPAEAYTIWAAKRTTFTRIPRRFIWNLRSCMDWFSRGCPRISSYIVDVGIEKQFIGYDPKTDELILRG